MATNKLMEAAAEILAGSKKSAPAMPADKLAGEVQDLGGPTPQNSKPDDDSNKIDAGKGATQTAAPTTKPSDASPDTQLKMNKEDSEIEEIDLIDDDLIDGDLIDGDLIDEEIFESLSEEEQKNYVRLDEISNKTLNSYLKKRGSANKAANNPKPHQSPAAAYDKVDLDRKKARKRLQMRAGTAGNPGRLWYIKPPKSYGEEVELEERSLTEPEMKKKEEIVKSMKKKMPGFKERYGERAKSVMYATATRIAKEKA